MNEGRAQKILRRDCLPIKNHKTQMKWKPGSIEPAVNERSLVGCPGKTVTVLEGTLERTKVHPPHTPPTFPSHQYALVFFISNLDWVPRPGVVCNRSIQLSCATSALPRIHTGLYNRQRAHQIDFLSPFLLHLKTF